MDWAMNDDDFTPSVHSAPAGEREILPAGIHTMTIRVAEEGPNQWKTHDTNPDGLCLKLRLACGNYKFVFDDLPKHLPWRGKQLADALGIVPQNGVLTIDPSDIEGMELSVEVEHYTSRAGRLSAVVKRYVPAAEQRRHGKSVIAGSSGRRHAPSAVDDVPFLWLVPVLASLIGGAA